MADRGGLPSLGSGMQVLSERVRLHSGAAVQPWPSVLICRYSPTCPMRIDVSSDDPELRPADCLTALKGETLRLLAMPLAGSDGIATLVALERQRFDEEQVEPIESRASSAQEFGESHVISRRYPRGHLGLFAVTRSLPRQHIERPIR